jgi:TonB family protein
MKNLDHDKIAGIEVLKGERAVKRYGEKGRDGVIVIISKEKDQTYKLSGRVLDDATGEPLQGASVVIVNTSAGAMTGPEGRFTLTMDKPEAEIAFSFVGYQTVRQKVKTGEPLSVRLKKGIIRLDLKDVKAQREPVSRPASGKADDEIFFVVEDVPHFPGELPALKKYLAEHVKYPPKAKKKGITGTVWVNFTVDENGQVKQVYVDKANSVDPLLDKEAVRVVSSLPDWTPGKQRGKAVPVELSVPVEFK